MCFYIGLGINLKNYQLIDFSPLKNRDVSYVQEW